MRSADVRALVPVEAEPAQPVEDAGDHVGRRALDVGVFDAQDERAAVAPRVEPVEERRAGAADVQVTGRRGREADARAPRSHYDPPVSVWMVDADGGRGRSPCRIDGSGARAATEHAHGRTDPRSLDSDALMELRHLRYLVAVADELHFGRAAIRLNISQPPLSLQIRQLEDELGLRLFQRNKRQVQLTEAGKRMVTEAQQVLSRVDHFVRAAARASEGELGHLSVGTPAGINDVLLDTLRVFAKRFPAVHIELQHISTGAQIERLREGRIRVGFLSLPVDDHGTLVLERIRTEAFGLALPKRHPLTRYQRVPLAALAEHRFILFPRRVNPGFHDVITALCRSAGVSLNTWHEVDNIVAALNLVRAGLGVAFCPASMQRLYTEVVFRPLRDSVLHAEYAVAYRRDAESPVLDSFLRVVHASRSQTSLALTRLLQESASTARHRARSRRERRSRVGRESLSDEPRRFALICTKSQCNVLDSVEVVEYGRPAAAREAMNADSAVH